MERSQRGSLVIISLAGLGAASLTMFLVAYDSFLATGFFFGLAISIYFTLYEERRDFAKMAAFVSVCAAAFPISMTIGDNLGFQIAKDKDVAGLFVAGCIGASFVLVAGMYVFGPRDGGLRTNLESFVRALMWSIGGGVLGTFGATPRGLELLLVIWQTGVAFLLGLMLRQERSMKPAGISSETMADELPGIERPRCVQIAATISLIVVLGFYGRFVSQFVHTRSLAAQQQADSNAARKLQIAEAPSLVGMPPIIPVKLDDAVILHPIEGLYPIHADSGLLDMPELKRAPYAVFSVEYNATEDPLPDMRPGLVMVQVKESPNHEWADFLAKYPSEPRHFPATMKRVVKFGQSVDQDLYRSNPIGRDSACFDWPSKNFSVSVCYTTSVVDEEFLKDYLEKYPSSWLPS